MLLKAGNLEKWLSFSCQKFVFLLSVKIATLWERVLFCPARNTSVFSFRGRKIIFLGLNKSSEVLKVLMCLHQTHLEE